MQSLERTYRGYQGWNAGPHVFLCAGAPNPANDGIWIGTPISHAGIHAGKCNSDHFGMEIVGNYDFSGWSQATSDLVYGTIITLLRWLGVRVLNDADTTHLAGHRECLNNKSCPGSAIDCKVVRRKVMQLMTTPNVTPTPTPVNPMRDVQVIGVTPSISFEQFMRVLSRHPCGLNPTEMKRCYDMCVWLDVDPTFMLALWNNEAPPWGQSPLQLKSNCPINARAVAGETRHTTPGPDGKPFLRFETQQLGFMYSVVHMKEQYGAEGQLTVREIAQKFTGSTAEQAIAYGDKLMNFMAELRKV
jgi:hypothetical protein